VLKNKGVQETAMAWVLLMLFAPVTGLILFIIFGVDFRSAPVRRFIHKDSLRRFKEDMPLELVSKLFPVSCSEKIEERFRPLASQIEACGEWNKLYPGNDIEVITTGVRKCELLMEDIKAARKSIHMEYFRFGNDESGRNIRDLLIQKASEGVEVRFLLNNFAALRIPASFWTPMKEAGVQVVKYSGLQQGLRLFISRLNSQQHRKIVVIDGRIGYTGGMNINDNYFKSWKDTHLRIVGPAVSSLQASFLDTWISCKGEVSKPLPEYFDPAEPAQDGKLVQMVFDESNLPWPTTQMAYEWVLANAKDYVYFQTPYFVPPDSFLLALKAAALRGVDVKILMSKHVDTALLSYFNRAYFAECLEAGVQMLESDGKFNHSKTMVADDYLAVIGSSNLDVRSFTINSEVNAFVYDRQTARECKDSILMRLSGATQWTLESWRASRSFFADLVSRFVRLFYREF